MSLQAGGVGAGKPAHALQPQALGRHGHPVTLGVLGGGQLGRMFVHAAQAMGFRTAVLDPDPQSPAATVAHLHVPGSYDDEQGLARLAQACDAVTTEFENVPASSLRWLAQHLHVAPSADAVAHCQHRAREKALFERCGVPCAPHARIESRAEVDAVSPKLFPGLLKTATEGYDGKGQVQVTHPRELARAWDALGGRPCLLEQRVELKAEISVVLARGRDGHMVHLPVQQNLHRDGILAVTRVPAADVDEATCAQACVHAQTLANAIGYVGVLCVEFFVLADGRLLANEMAPRPHNSGHHSLDACELSQFELQVRALAGLPLGTARQHSAAVMLNLLGDLWFRPCASAAGAPPVSAAHAPAWEQVLAIPGAHLHLYGKSQPRVGRKMGHLTLTAAQLPQALSAAREAAGHLGMAPF